MGAIPPRAGRGESALAMADDARAALEKVLDYCSRKWLEADQAAAGAIPPPDMLTGEKKAYNEVFHYIRVLLDDSSCAGMN